MQKIKKLFQGQPPIPVSTPATVPTLSETGSASSTATEGNYYVAYSWQNEEGETLVSPTQSMTTSTEIVDAVDAPTFMVTDDAESTLPIGTYYVKYTWKNDIGETLASAEASQDIEATGKALVVVVPSYPAGTNGVNIYISDASGTQTYQGTTQGTNFTFKATLDTGSRAVPTENTTHPQINIAIPALPESVEKAKVYAGHTELGMALQGETSTGTFTITAPLLNGEPIPNRDTIPIVYEALNETILKSILLTNVIADSVIVQAYIVPQGQTYADKYKIIDDLEVVENDTQAIEVLAVMEKGDTLQILVDKFDSLNAYVSGVEVIPNA